MKNTSISRQLIPLLSLNFVNVLGFAVLIPVFPFLVEDFGGNELTYGILIATYPFFQFIGAPILGSLSDAYGRKPILIISQIGTLLSWVIFGLALLIPPIPMLGTSITLPIVVIAFSRIVDGITGGNFSVASASIADFTPKHKKTRTFGMIGAIVGIGLIIGPFIGGYTSSFALGYLGVVLFSIVLSLLTLILMYLYLAETLAKEKRTKLDLTAGRIISEINVYKKIKGFNMPIIKKLFFIRSFFAFVFSAYTTTVVIFLKDRFELTTNQIGIFFLLLGAFFIFSQIITTPYLAKRYGNLRTYYVGQVFIFVGLIALVFVSNIPLLVVVIFIISFGVANSFPTFKSLITDLVDESRQGEVTGLDESVLAGTSAIAPIVAGAVYAVIKDNSYFIFALILVLPHIIVRLRTGKIFVKEPKTHR